jgi:3-methyladenine DNA glycosylase AlkC
VPEEVSLEHWKITPAKVQAYMKTKEWEQLLRSAARTVAEKTEAAIEASVARKEQSASETSKSEN